MMLTAATPIDPELSVCLTLNLFLIIKSLADFMIFIGLNKIVYTWSSVGQSDFCPLEAPYVYCLT